MTQKAPTDLRQLRSRLRFAENEIAACETIFDRLGVDTRTSGGARYSTSGRARRLATEVQRLRKVARRDG